MEMITNPVLPGFNPDPCVCRRGKDYYLAVSSFEWFPAVPIYHSRNLTEWRLCSHAIQNERVADLRRLPSAKGIWAPDITWCEEEGLFYLLFSVMNSMEGRFFDVDNYLITAPDITGPWSEPVYIHSAGFDPSILHDEEGRKYIVSLEWETRDGYHKPGVICCVEYDTRASKIIGRPKRVWGGGTRRGCIEGPHLYKRDGWYYLLCAEGGTGYGHSATMARSRSPFGPYQGDPCNPILTSTPDFDEMDNDDAVKLNRYNPASVLQKSGHGSIVETPEGETYMFHHAARPFLPELRCTLGRETCMQKMYWTEDDWLRLEGGGNMAKLEVPQAGRVFTLNAAEGKEPSFAFKNRLGLYAPRIAPASFVDFDMRADWARLRGQESLCSQNRVSLLAHKLTCLHTTIETCIAFETDCYQVYAGLALYYDNTDYILLRKAYCEKLDGPVVDLLRVKNGTRTYVTGSETPVKAGNDLIFQMRIDGRSTSFYWGYSRETLQQIGPQIDTSEFSDEFCDGEFTGTFAGACCVDALTHSATADFAYLEFL